MPKPKNRPWTAEDVQQLRKLAGDQTPADEIARILKRTTSAIRTRCSQDNIRLPQFTAVFDSGGSSSTVFERRRYRTAEEKAVLSAEREAAAEIALAEIRQREQTLRSNMERLRAERLAREQG